MSRSPPCSRGLAATVGRERSALRQALCRRRASTSLFFPPEILLQSWEMREIKRGGDDLTGSSCKGGRPRDGKGQMTESLASFLEEVQKTKRDGDYFTRRMHKSRRGCNGERQITNALTSGDLHGDSNQDIWTGLSDELKSNLSKSVASLALCYGDRVLFSCSGIIVKCQEHLTRLVTSASLVIAFTDAKKKHHNLKIEVCPEGNEVYQGSLSEYDLDRNFAVVIIRTSLDVDAGLFKRVVGGLPRGMVLALGRSVSGRLMVTSVMLPGDLSKSEDHDLICKMAEAWEGAALFTSDGNFVGMSLFLVMEGACFISWAVMLKWLECMQCTSLKKNTDLRQSKSLKGVRIGARQIGEKSYGHQKDGMTLVNTFEETFGDIYPKGVWREFSTKASSIYHNVVALASFNGKKRNFACTGFFIEWNGSTAILTSASLVRSSSDENKIEENLMIEVLLPNKLQVKGTLLHYSLHYNVALVGVKDCHVRPANIQPHQYVCSKVAAVGRCFKSGALMATIGDGVSWSGTLDCGYIVRSSCKITKVGIGGPLINLDGEVIGMNFYDRRIGTPFLKWNTIDKILAHFCEKSTAGEAGRSVWKIPGDRSNGINRWPVPMPCWRHPDNVDEDLSEDDEFSFGYPSYCRKQYGYINGVKVLLF
ncbi:uncharacterized protein [Miscanthus floridulus]|uniref:uncharacterized protein n=1 Tax=Miscanthus floridulus TaxID=154761 RepID=UPI00345755BC